MIIALNAFAARILSVITVLAGTVLDDIATAMTAVASWFTSLITALIPIFWDAAAATPTLTFIGWLTVIGFCLGLVFGVFRVIRSFVRI